MPQYKRPRAEQIAVGIGVCAAVCGTAYCLHKYIFTPPSLLMAEETAKMDIEHQAIDVPDIPGAKRSAFCEELLDSYDGITTAYEAYLRGAEISGDKQCLGTNLNGSYSWITYNEVLQKAADLGSGILELGYQPCPETFVGIYASNKAEWVLTDVACLTYSMVSVPLYDSLGADACTYIINHAEISVVVCDGNKLPVLLEKADQCPKLKHIIKIGDVSEEDEQNAGKFGITIKSFKDMEVKLSPPPAF
ncbi:long-chain-fatty-acid-- ligase 1-like [Paramuricea clavata]|uniref:long-chain-fatty-acid--CoA ligase n=1 Tax=Paramuricea clavata TaxID=317549 RepID=A0A6S7I2K1_PARCT|nr:long-chain-fatty-acid-- ligase 1-like [Paramuricea clavata]